MIYTQPTTFVASVNENALARFKKRLSGELLCPDDQEYETARRIWNGDIDKHPALIVRCRDAGDVIEAVRFARNHNLTVAVRGGGHNTAGLALCDDGLVIDLSLMKKIRVDPEKHTARAEPGLTLGELVRATEPYGLVTTTGIVSETGIAGLTVGGGMGWLAGKFGLTCDNVLAFDVVTADGHIRRADANTNADLFWALRGGGGNYGVVTAFEYQLHPLKQILGGMILHPIARAREVLQFYRDFSRRSPDELTVYAALLSSPEGQPVVGMIACYAGNLTEGERVLLPLRQFGPPIVDMIHPQPYSEILTLLDAMSTAGQNYFEKASAVRELTDPVIDTLIAAAQVRTFPLSIVILQHLHGAATRVAPGATAFALREDHYEIGHIAHWIEGAGDAHIGWARDSWQALQPFASAGSYVNFLDGQDSLRVRASYADNYARLVALKNKYDPTNFFHMNQNIKPTVNVDERS